MVKRKAAATDGLELAENDQAGHAVVILFQLYLHDQPPLSIVQELGNRNLLLSAAIPLAWELSTFTCMRCDLDLHVENAEAARPCEVAVPAQGRIWLEVRGSVPTNATTPSM